jgi:hypothetical protein
LEDKEKLKGFVAQMDATILKWEASVKENRKWEDKVKAELVAIRQQYINRVDGVLTNPNKEEAKIKEEEK